VKLLEGAAGQDAAAIADRIAAAALAFQGGHARDDLALVVLRVPPT
jgi:serine phosphatase RsbU (regulator of sigma subunit)